MKHLMSFKVTRSVAAKMYDSPTTMHSDGGEVPGVLRAFLIFLKHHIIC